MTVMFSASSCKWLLELSDGFVLSFFPEDVNLEASLVELCEAAPDTWVPL